MKKRVKFNPHNDKSDPTIRLNISMPRSDHEFLVEVAKQKGVSLSRLLVSGARCSSEQKIEFTKELCEFAQTIIGLIGPVSLIQLLDLFQKHKEIKTKTSQ